MIDGMIQDGYASILENDYPGGCDKWLEAWEAIKELFAKGTAKDIFDLDSKYQWQQFPSNYVQDAEVEMHNAGVEDSIYHQKRITFCEELLQWSGTDELFTGNTRISMAEAYIELGDTGTAEQLYREWLQDDPEWGWGYIGWSDHYRFNFDGKRHEKAEEILLAGYAHEGLRDRIDVVARLKELYEEMNKPDKVKEYKKKFSELQRTEAEGSYYHKPAPVRAAKTGRNEPCPCGSGKKYKKCCGA
jgi:tetratricopeptide (TPR) repeat protein